MKNINAQDNDYHHSDSKILIEAFSDNEIIEMFNESNTLIEFSRKLGYKSAIDYRNKIISNKLNELQLNLEKFNISTIKKERTKNFFCLKCGKAIDSRNKSKLCHECYVEKNNNDKIEKWLKTGDTGCQPGSTIKNCIRDYIYKEQDYKCCICGNENIWNGKEIKFILDHINGDASNNKRENLRLICPNCDSQLDTYKSKNKNSARSFRHKYYQHIAS